MVYSATRRYVIASFLAGLSYLLMFLSFAVIPLVPYMKIDFSDLPILFGMFLFGPLGGIEIAILRSLLYFLISGPSIASLIGVSTNLLASLCFCLPVFYILRKSHDVTASNIGRSILAGTASLTVVLSLANYFVITPLYMAVLGMKLSLPLSHLVLYGVVPFNLIKGVLVGTAFWLLFTKLRVWLKDRSVVMH
ncbi:ECF transporter S component [Liquorilactobacillus satsumensis]|uniref:ECF transporter S component n=1 Tax=Liquorilactobacillus satsumensis TaxID=259059 RepID=UPI0021C33FFF|nr:ECF transporter S component [Liquorilactobacillus satsumensis]MCP9327827.1 ECF transporter S component [Liquorilactobacillus satsumensis]